MPFHYNPSDKAVIASTSPFWTILLIFFYFLAGYNSIILLKIFLIFIFIAVTYFLRLIAQNIWKFTRSQSFILILFWVLNVSVIKNTFGGMENILSCFQLLLLFYLIYKYKDSFAVSKIIILGALSGWTLLTRPEIGALSVMIALSYFFVDLVSRKVTLKNFIVNVLIFTIAAFIILLPWYLYQYNMTGKILSDSSYSRIYSGRWNAIVIIPGLLYYHPGLTFIFITAFLPLTAGALLCLKKLKKIISEFRMKGSVTLFENFNKISAVMILLFGFICYSFVVGGDQTGRYFLPFYPFFFILGFSGLSVVYYQLNKKPLMQKIFVILLAVFLSGVNAYDYYGRVITGGQLESDIEEMINSPSRRKDFTDGYLKRLQFKTEDTIHVALGEIQLRYYVDDRIILESLDGRTSNKIFKYTDKNGFPDFERYLTEVRPDVVVVNEWHPENSFLAGIFKFLKTERKDNLLLQWNRELSDKEPGYSFLWKGNKLTLVIPGHLKIEWR